MVVNLFNAVTGQPCKVYCYYSNCNKFSYCRLKYSTYSNMCENKRSDFKLKLLKLVLKNFKGTRDLTINAEGKNIDIYGDNEAGKTTVFDSITWLLFGKDSLNRSDFEIKTLDSDGKALQGLDHEVEGVFEVNGTELKLRRVYREVYTKKRGSATEEFSGHTTDFYINEVPVKKSEYEERIKQIAPDKLFKLLTNPLYFNEQLKWDECRKILFEVCGEVNDTDIINSDKKFKELEKILKGNDTESHKKIIMATRKRVNEKLEQIQPRLDEVNNSKPNISSINFEDIKTNIEAYQRQVESLREKIEGLKAGNGIIEKQKQVLEIDKKILEIRNKESEELSNLSSLHNKKLFELKEQLREVVFSKETNSRLIEGFKKTLQGLEQKRDKLRQEWTETNGLTYTGSNICPTCQQQMPESFINEAIANFNLSKSEKLQGINEAGKAFKVDIEKIQNEIFELTNKVEVKEIKESELKKEIEKLEVEKPALKGIFDKSLDEKNLLQEKEALLLSIEKLKENTSSEEETLRASIQDIEKEIEFLRTEYAKKEQFENAEARRKELIEEQKTLSAEFSQLEKELFLIEEFTKTKVKLLDEKINSKFKNARFKLFEEQINGALQECCTVTYKGVPYSDLNNAARINMGLEIISLLSDHYKFTAPIVVDNAESVTKLYELNAQIIRLIVSEKDKKLRVEIA